MAEDHFKLDIDPETLTTVQGRLETLADHLRTKGTEVKQTPGEIGEQWTGGAADTIMGEMTGLGTLMKGFATNVDAIAVGAGSLAGDYQDALDELPRLNREWEQAETDYTTAMTAADNAHADGLEAASTDDRPANGADRDELGTIRTGAYNRAFDARQETQHNLEISFGYTCQWLGQQTRAFSDILVEQTPVNVPESALEDLAAGTMPRHPFDHSALLEGLTLVQQYEENTIEEIQQSAQDDVDELQDILDDTSLDNPEDLQEALDELGDKADDPIYAQAFAEAGGPDLVNDIYDRAQYYVTSGYVSEDAWVGPLSAFNDVMAAGLAEYTDIDLAEFTARFDNDENGPRLGAITGSEYSDERLAGLALALSAHMRYDLPKDHDGAVDVGLYLQDAAYDGDYLEMVQSLSDRTDPDRLAEVLNNADPEVRERLLRELSDLNAYDHRVPLDPDSYRIRMDMMTELLESSRDSNFPETFEGVLRAIQDSEDSLELSQYPLDLKEFLTDTDTIDYLTQSRTSVDQALIADIFGDYMEDEDLENMLEDMIGRNGEDGVLDSVTARNAGYLLGLARAADFDLNVSSAIKPIADAALAHLLEEAGKASTSVGRSLPLINTAIAVLEGFSEQYAEAAEREGNFGSEYTDEQLHENLAWIIYLQNHGAPESYETWLQDAEAQRSVSSSDPLSAATQYLTWLEDAENNGQATAAEIRELQDLINGSRMD